MDPIMRAWMFHNWIEDFYDEHKTLENQGFLIGSFINPELVKKILGKDTETHISDDEEFEALAKQIRQQGQEQNSSLKKRQRKRKSKLQG